MIEEKLLELGNWIRQLEIEFENDKNEMKGIVCGLDTSPFCAGDYIYLGEDPGTLVTREKRIEQILDKMQA